MRNASLTKPSEDSLCGINPASYFDLGGATSAGEGQTNEDSYFIAGLAPAMSVVRRSETVRLSGMVKGPESGVLMLIADGMGGLSHGELASRLAVEGAACFALNNVTSIKPNNGRKTIPGVREQLTEAIAAGDSHLRSGSPESNVGTTLTLGYLVWPILYVAHVGDTRAYVLRGGKLRQLTHDHTLAQTLERRDLEGSDTVPSDTVPEDRAAQWNHVLWNCLGNSGTMPEPEITKVMLDEHDRWLFCSDGLYRALSEEAIIDQLRGPRGSEQIATGLVRAAVAAGAADDATALVGKRLHPE